MGMIRHLLALTNTTCRSIFPSPTLRTKTLLNPLHNHSPFPLQTQFSPLTIKTYSTNSSQNDLFSALPKPFTLAHHMSLRFVMPRKDDRKEVAKRDPRAENATTFAAISVPHKLYKPQIGDGACGGGVVCCDVAWGRRALFLAKEVLSQFGCDFKIYSFRAIPDGYVRVSIESFSHEYGCPSLEMLNDFFDKYRKRLVEDRASSGMISDDLGVEVGCPGPHRLLKVPDDLSRFKDLPLMVCYVDSDGKEQKWVFFFCSVEKEQGYCVWNLSDYDGVNKDKPVSRGTWTLKLPFETHKTVTFFIRPSDVFVERR